MSRRCDRLFAHDSHLGHREGSAGLGRPSDCVPDEETWAGLSLDAREEVLERIEAVLDAHREAMSEGVTALDDAERQRSDALDPLLRVQVALAFNVLNICRLRGLALTDEQSARVASELDVNALTLWSERAFAAASGDELLAPR